MRKELLKVLADINEEVYNFEGDNLFDAGILDSLQAVDLVADLEDALDIEIDATYVIEENFKNKEAIIAMLEKILK